MALEMRKYLPETWNYMEVTSNQVVDNSSMEFQDLCSEIGLDKSKVRMIKRVQNENRYYMFLTRQQHLLALHPKTPFFVVRRFVKLTTIQPEEAIDHNLDLRRKPESSSQYIMEKTVSSLHNWKHILVVQVVTKNHEEIRFTPTRDSDYYIEYIVESQ